MGNTTSILTPTDWTDYELIDSGEGAKLERFGTYVVSRPDPRAIWKRRASEAIWNTADARYVRDTNVDGRWDIRTQPRADWSVSWKDIRFTLKPTSFKHVGVFPEQSVNWDWIMGILRGKAAKVLNLFAYTGGATMAAAKAGAEVTHVDSSKGTTEWAKENARISGISNSAIRWIIDDAYKFALRESRRGSTYDGIILDPPRFGRGAKGEIWKIEEDAPKLLETCSMLLSKTPLFILVNAYTADLSSIAIANLLRDFTDRRGGDFTSGDLALKDTTSGRFLPSGIFARWSR